MLSSHFLLAYVWSPRGFIYSCNLLRD